MFNRGVSSVALSTFASCATLPIIPLLNFSPSWTETLSPLNAKSPFPQSPHPPPVQAPANVLSDSMNLTILGTLCKQNQTLFVCDLDCKEIQPVHSEGDQPWDFFGRNDAQAETPVLWPPHVNSWLIGKDSDAGRDWGQEEKGMTEDEMAGWHHWLDGRESE